MGTQSQDPGVQKQGTPGTPGSSQEQDKRQDQQRGKGSPQQGKDAGQVPTSDDDIEAGTDEGSNEEGTTSKQPRNS